VRAWKALGLLTGIFQFKIANNATSSILTNEALLYIAVISGRFCAGEGVSCSGKNCHYQLPYGEPEQFMQASSPKPIMASMGKIAMFATDITACRINSLGCHKFTSSNSG
jgi:hypothetical protein